MGVAPRKEALCHCLLCRRFADLVVGLEAESGIADDDPSTPEAGKEELMAEEKPKGSGDVTPTPVEVDDSDIGAGVDTGVWVTALICVVLILLAIFAL